MASRGLCELAAKKADMLLVAEISNDHGDSEQDANEDQSTFDGRNSRFVLKKTPNGFVHLNFYHKTIGGARYAPFTCNSYLLVNIFCSRLSARFQTFDF